MEQELAFRLLEDQIEFRTQVEIPVTRADLYFPLAPRPLLVFVDGTVYLGDPEKKIMEKIREVGGISRLSL